jgi:ABC-type amino acid transport system permease subunit
MTTAMFAITAFLIGAILGLRFKVFMLIPAAIVSLAVIAGIGFASGNSTGYIMFVAFLGLTALQFGYVTGGVLGSFAGKPRGEKDPGEIAAVVQLPGKSAKA